MENNLKFSFSENLIEAGIDEAGCGCLAGPVYSAAVIWNNDPEVYSSVDDTKEFRLLTERGDSKKLTKNQREECYYFIKEYALDYGIGIATHQEIDKRNILTERVTSMHRAIENLDIEPDLLLIDGNFYISNGIPYQLIEQGDSKFISIAAASILAKVERDRFMVKMHRKYPEYGFAMHKGYGTKLHYNNLQIHGPSPIHRLTFNLKLN